MKGELLRFIYPLLWKRAVWDADAGSAALPDAVGKGRQGWQGMRFWRTRRHGGWFQPLKRKHKATHKGQCHAYLIILFKIKNKVKTLSNNGKVARTYFCLICMGAEIYAKLTHMQKCAAHRGTPLRTEVCWKYPNRFSLGVARLKKGFDILLEPLKETADVRVFYFAKKPSRPDWRKWLKQRLLRARVDIRAWKGKGKQATEITGGCWGQWLIFGYYTTWTTGHWSTDDTTWKKRK